MLAKIWKKVLFAICIIACLFNVVSKIVSRNSLEINLKSVNDGNTIWDSVKTKNETSNTSDKIEGVKDSSSNNSSENNVKKYVFEDEDDYNRNVNDDEDNYNRDDSNDEDNKNTFEEEDDDKTYRYSDYTIVLDE